jgi:hypothetical protein
LIWFYERAGEALRVETFFDRATDEYVLVINWSDRPVETERFGTITAFHTRVDRLEQRLVTEQWAPSAAPQILPDGWRGPI